MPAKSKAQQRFFGLVRSVQKGDTPKSDVSSDVKKAAKTMTKKEVDDFAKTKTKKLPEKVKKITESQLKNIIKECVSKILSESYQYDDDLDYQQVYDEAINYIYRVHPRHQSWRSIAEEIGFRLDTIGPNDMETLKDAIEDAMMETYDAFNDKATDKNMMMEGSKKFIPLLSYVCYDGITNFPIHGYEIDEYYTSNPEFKVIAGPFKQWKDAERKADEINTKEEEIDFYRK